MRCNLDINECTKYPCEPNKKCINSPGTFHCVQTSICEEGFEFNSETQQCEGLWRKYYKLYLTKIL